MLWNSLHSEPAYVSAACRGAHPGRRPPGRSVLLELQERGQEATLLGSVSSPAA